MRRVISAPRSRRSTAWNVTNIRRPETTIEGLAKLKPAFDPAGTVTAGNASGINDGAAMLVLCDDKTADQRGWQPLAAIEAAAVVGCDPKLMGLGPVHAIRRLCDQHRLKLDDFDTVELNEAFASQSLACLAELQLDPARVNVDGGAIAIGHPIGASGCTADRPSRPPHRLRLHPSRIGDVVRRRRHGRGRFRHAVLG